MKKLLVILGIAGLVLSCSTITKRLEKGEQVKNRLGLAFAHEQKYEDSITEVVRLPERMEFIDKNGVKQTLIPAIKEGDDIMPLFELREVKVEAKLRSIAERNGKIDMDFIITVPKSLINKKWQLRVYPKAFKERDALINLEPLVLSGADFLKMQKAGYDAYKRFVASIIPDSLYWKEMVNRKGYNKALADLEQDYYNAWKRDQLLQDQWIDWRDKINQRYLIFNEKMRKNKASLNPEQTLVSLLPQYWLERHLTEEFIPSTFAEYALGNKSIARKKVSKRDSLEIERKFTDIKRIAENERKRQELESKFNELVKFPHIAARLDTIVEGKDAFQYYYTQELMTDQDSKKIRLVLNGEVVAIDMSKYNVPHSDTLTYTVSAMVDLLDESPRYTTEVVYRQVAKKIQANIEYHQGRSDIDLSLSRNKDEFQRISEMAESIERTGELALDSIEMRGYASPEGNEHLNYKLSDARMKSFHSYIIANKLFRKKVPLKTSVGGENWDGLMNFVSDSLNLPPFKKNDLKNLIHSVKSMDEREEKIKALFPDVHQRLVDECYPNLRVTEINFFAHRTKMVKDTVHTRVPDQHYNLGRDLLRQRKYSEALEILKEYKSDYNLAIAYLSLGHNRPAFEILKRYPEEPNSLYLLSIIEVREGRIEEALKNLLRSAELDKRKIFRANLDPELSLLIKKYGLFKEVLQ